MKADQIKTIAIIGAGTMGRQIAMQAALCGEFSKDSVLLCCRSLESKDKVGVWADAYIQNRLLKGRINEKKAAEVRETLSIVTDIEDAVKNADLIIESITEDIEIKRECFAYISSIAREDAVLATNSSNIVSSRLADIVKNSSRLLNIHFLNPALVIELVEVVHGPHTSAKTVQTVKDFITKIGKTPIVLEKEIAGFVVNRINAAVTQEACKLLEQGIASAEEIDLACEKGLKYPMGPFRLMDLVGIDVHYQIRSDRYKESKDPYDAPSSVVFEKVKRGEYGRKTGKGWYIY